MKKPIIISTPSSVVSAFTIVELLVVIVVIGVLVSITVVSYSGITNRAVIANAQSDLSNASKKLKIYQLNNEDEDYPIDEATAIAAKLIPDDTNYSYYVDNTTNPKTFCISYINQDSNIAYSINQDGSPIPAPYCPVLYLDASNPNSYPGSGTTWYDLSGYGNDITLYNGVGFDSSSGGSLTFDGVNDWASISGFKSNITGTFTISAWMKFDKYAYMDILQMQGTSAFKWRINGQNTYWNIYNSSRWDNSLSYLMAPNINEWHCYTFTYDGADEKIYLDGVLKNQFTKNITLATPTNFILAPSGGEILDGAISSVSIYNRALSNAEISVIFNALKARYGL